MIEVIRYLLFSSAAAGVGVVAGYFYGRHHLETDYFKTLNDEVAKADKFYRDKYEEEKKSFLVTNKSMMAEMRAGVEQIEAIRKQEAEKIVSAVIAEETVPKEDVRDEIVGNPVNRQAADQALVNYAGMYAGPTLAQQEKVMDERPPLDEGEEYYEDFTPEEEPDPNALPEPDEKHEQALITEDEYAQNQFDYIQYPRVYFAGDDKFVTATDIEVPQGERLASLGPYISDYLKRWSASPGDAIHVRNPEAQTEYEIYYDPNRFADVVPNR